MMPAQRDLFAPAAPQLAMARMHRLNDRAFDGSDYHAERIECGPRHRALICVCRSWDGYRARVDWQGPDFGCGGPIFILDPVFPTFAEARADAIGRAIAALSRSKSNVEPIIKALEALPT